MSSSSSSTTPKRDQNQHTAIVELGHKVDRILGGTHQHQPTTIQQAYNHQYENNTYSDPPTPLGKSNNIDLKHQHHDISDHPTTMNHDHSNSSIPTLRPTSAESQPDNMNVNNHTDIHDPQNHSDDRATIIDVDSDLTNEVLQPPHRTSTSNGSNWLNRQSTPSSNSVARDNIRASVTGAATSTSTATSTTGNVNIQALVNTIMFIVTLTVLLAQLIATSVVLGLTWNMTCDTTLIVFNVGYAVRVLMYLPLVIFKRLHPEIAANNDRFMLCGILTYRQVKTYIELIAFGWFVYGNWAFYTSTTCQHGNPAVYNLTLSWIIIGFVAIGLPALVLAGFIFCFPIIFLFMRVLVRLAPERFTEVLGGVTSSQIEKHTKIVTYKRGMFDAEHNQCGICLADYAEDDKLRVLPCSHTYHSNCVDSWLKLKATCPNCRQHIITGREEPDEGTPQQQILRALTPPAGTSRAASTSNRNGLGGNDNDNANDNGDNSNNQAIAERQPTTAAASAAHEPANRSPTPV